MPPVPVYADSVDAALVGRLDGWYANAGNDRSRPFPFEVLTSWVRAMGYERPWTISSDRTGFPIEAPWGSLIDPAELAVLIGQAGDRGRTWSRRLDAIERGDDPELARRARNERTWAWAVSLAEPLSVKRSGPSALAPALYVRGLIEAGMGQRQAVRYVIGREGYSAGEQYIDTLAGSRLAQYRRVWRRLGILPAGRAQAA